MSPNVFGLTDLQAVVPQLARSLGTDEALQGDRLLSVAECLERTFHSNARQELTAALNENHMQLLQELSSQRLRVEATCMQQLTVQLSDPAAAHADTVQPASAFCRAMKFAWACVVKQKMPAAAPPTAPPSGRRALVLQDAGDRSHTACHDDTG